jgi:flagella basal body P-ring formation protein FlgA
VPTLITAINRKDIIGESDLQMTDLDLASDSRGLIHSIEQIVGKEATKNLLRGQPLRKSDLKAAIVIKRGQTIDLLSKGMGITVKMRGKALGNGAEGDRLLVENLSSRKRVEGEVLATGQVLIR